MLSAHNRFYDDVYSVMSRWEFLILGIQALLLWERVIPSLLFNFAVHLIFWTIALTDLSSLFIICILLTIYVLLDLSRNFISRLVNGKSISMTFSDSVQSPGSFSEFVNHSLKNGHILSVEELSEWTARILSCYMSILNRLAPCRRDRPVLFFLITSITSLICIWIGTSLPGLLLSYAALNIFLVTPLLLHHKVLSRLWATLKPILERIEAEFDRNPLEPISQRLAGEAELYEPIIAAAKASHPELLASDDGEGFLSDEFLFHHPQKRRSNGDLDTSEAVFIKQFVPEMSNEEIDKLFADALVGASTHDNQRSTENLRLLTPALPTVTASAGHERTTPWVISDEYATDDDVDIDEMSNDDELSSFTNGSRVMEDYVVVSRAN